MSNVSVYWLSSNVISLILNVCTYLNHITSRKLLKNETAKRKPKQNKLTLLVIGDLQLLLRKQKPQLGRWWKHDDASKWQKSKVYKRKLTTTLLLKPINLLRKMQKTDGYWWSHQPGTIPIQYYPKSKDFLSWTWFLHILQNLQQISFSPNHVIFSSVFCFFISHSIFLQEFSISIAAACLYFTYGSYQLYLHSLSLVQYPSCIYHNL